VEGTAQDVTDSYKPSGPTVGQIAQSSVETSYTEGTNVGGRGSETEMGFSDGVASTDVMAATDIINSEVSQTGGLSLETAQAVQNSTGMSMQEINDIAMNAGAGTTRGTDNVNRATDIITSEINRTGGLSLETAQQVAESTGLSIVEINDIASNVAISGTSVTTPNATDVATSTTLPSTTGDTASTAGTGIGTIDTTGVSTTGTAVTNPSTTDVSTVEDIATTDVAVTADPSTTADIIDSTATEITGAVTDQTTANTTTNTNTNTATNTNTTTVSEPPEEEETVTVEVDDTGTPDDGGDVDVTVDDGVDDGGEQEEPPFECPEGYTAVKLAGRWVCQRTSATQVTRPTLGTDPYLSKTGFAGTNPNPVRPRTITTTETVEGS
jgi:hypothetical protein